MSSYKIKSSRQVRLRPSAVRKTGRSLESNRAGHAHAEGIRPAAHRLHAAQSFSEREELAVKLLPLVKRVALELRERLPQHIDLEDLTGAGALGLLDAVRKFDARKHVKVETYARHRIRGAILDSLREMDPASRDMRKKNKAAEKVYRQLQTELGRAVTDDEMAQALGISLKRWYRTLQDLNSVGVEWMRPNQIPEVPLLEEANLPADDRESPFEQCYLSEQRAILERALALLPEREKMVISLYYESELTMKQIGDRLGIDESRVSQIHSVALSHLRAKARRMLKPAAYSAVPAFGVAAGQREAATAL